MAGVMVRIAAFQAVDPGPIPGPRIFLVKIILSALCGKKQARCGARTRD